MEPSPPSPTSTEGPDASDSDSSVYTASSSSSSSFSFSSSSSFYATSSSSSTSDKVSQLDTLNQVGGACLSGNFWLSLSPFVPPCTQFPLPIATFPFLLLLRKRSAPFSLPLVSSDSLPKMRSFKNIFVKKKTSNPKPPC